MKTVCDTCDELSYHWLEDDKMREELIKMYSDTHAKIAENLLSKVKISP